MHRSVGAVIRNNQDKILMLDRKNPPYGWACPAGHLDENEKPEEALIREVKEETNIEVKNYNLILHEFIDWNECKSKVRGHDYFVYEVVDWTGKPRNNSESKGMQWLNESEAKNYSFEPAWEYFINKLNLFKKKI